MNIAIGGLMAFFVWSSVATSTTLTLEASPTPEIAPPPAAEATAPVSVPAKKITESSSLNVLLTGYNAVPEQTDSDPSTTASGAFSNPEVIAAVSEDLRYGPLPFGTIIAVEAQSPTGPYCEYEAVKHLIGYRVVADVMNPRWTNMVDILFDSERVVPVRVDGATRLVNPARALGSCGNVTVRIVGTMKIKDIAATQADLAIHVEKMFAAK